MTTLHQQMIKSLVVRWKAGERAIYSGSIYTDIVGTGVIIPSTAMHDIFVTLQQRGIIQTRAFTGKIQQAEHGHVEVTWIAQQTLDRY